MNTVFQLYQLQSIDSEIDSSLKRIGVIENAINRSIEVENANSRMLDCEAELKKIKSDFNAIDFDIQQKKNKKAQSEASLYSGKISNPKELQDLQMEIASLKKILDELDDKLMEKLIIMEDFEAKFGQCEEELRIARTHFETQKSMLVAEKNNLENAIKNLNVKRISVVSQVQAETLSRYDSLRKAKNGFAVAKLQDDSCSACGCSLTASQCQQVRSSSQLFYCPSCGRIVYGS